MAKCVLPARVERTLNEYFENAVRLREMEWRHAFGYRVELARGELFEEYLDEKRAREARHECATRALEERHRRAVLRLRAAFEAEHAQDLTALEMWFAEQKSRVAADRADADAKSDRRDAADDRRQLSARIRVLDERLSRRGRELSVYGKRLKRVLAGYADFVKSTVPRVRRPGSLEKQLAQAERLMARVNEMDVGGCNIFENPSAADAKTTRCEKPRKI